MKRKMGYYAIIILIIITLAACSEPDGGTKKVAKLGLVAYLQVEVLYIDFECTEYIGSWPLHISGDFDMDDFIDAVSKKYDVKEIYSSEGGLYHDRIMIKVQGQKPEFFELFKIRTDKENTFKLTNCTSQIMADDKESTLGTLLFPESVIKEDISGGNEAIICGVDYSLILDNGINTCEEMCKFLTNFYKDSMIYEVNNPDKNTIQIRLNKKSLDNYYNLDEKILNGLPKFVDSTVNLIIDKQYTTPKIRLEINH